MTGSLVGMLLDAAPEPETIWAALYAPALYVGLCVLGVHHLRGDS